jgi:hypothetical protein
MTDLSPLAQRAVDRLGWLASQKSFALDNTHSINALVAAVESLVIAGMYGDIPKPADDFQRQLDVLAEAHGARLAALERVVNTRAD